MKPLPRLWRRVLIAAALVLLFTLVGFFVLPPIAKSQLEKRLSAELGRNVTVEKLRLNPYTLSLTLENFAIREADGAKVFVGWRRLYVNVAGFASLWREWALSEFDLDGFSANVAIRPDGSFDFSDILARVTPPDAPPGNAPPPPSEPAGPGRPLRVARLNVTDARIDFSDAAAKQPFATTLGPVTFALTEFHTASGDGAPYRFEAITEAGERFGWSGAIHAAPLRSTGEFSLENIALAKYAPYYAHHIQARLAEGKLGVRGRYEVNLAEAQRVAKLLDGAVQLRGLKLIDPANQEAVVEIPALDIGGIHADALAPKAAIDSVVVTGGHVRARRAEDGAINLVTLLQPAATDEAQASAAPSPVPPESTGAVSGKPMPPLALTVGEVALKDCRADVADLAAPRPVLLALDGIELSLRNVTLAEGAQMPLLLAFKLGSSGTVRLEGNLGITPIKADLTTDIAALEILPLSPYLEQFVNARITQGSVTAKLKTEASVADDSSLAASVSGDVTVEKLGLVDAVRNEELAGFGSLALRGLRASTGAGRALQVSLEEVNLAAPYARVIVAQDKSLNLASLARVAAAPAPAPVDPPATQSATPTPAVPPKQQTQPAAPAHRSETPAPAPPPAAAQPVIEIAKVVISDGDYRFVDRSLEPNVTMAINEFGGTIAGLSSTNPAKADLNLTAKVDGAGPVAIVGKVDLLRDEPSVDLKVDLKHVDLVPLSAYSGKFAGFELARGKLLLDVKLRVDGKKVDSANVITLNQFAFGQPVQSPEATKLPVRLGVALLKDLNGNIVIDVPVQGSTDDPSFAVGRVVLRVIVNLLTKAAVSPFSLLGAAFGGGGEELAFQEFAPGSSELQPEQTKKLETMVKALANRPGLSVDLQGS